MLICVIIAITHIIGTVNLSTMFGFLRMKVAPILTLMSCTVLIGKRISLLLPCPHLSKVALLLLVLLLIQLLRKLMVSRKPL